MEGGKFSACAAWGHAAFKRELARDLVRYGPWVRSRGWDYSPKVPLAGMPHRACSRPTSTQT